MAAVQLIDYIENGNIKNSVIPNANGKSGDTSLRYPQERSAVITQITAAVSVLTLKT